MRKWNAAALDGAGLNLQAVFDLDTLPAELGEELRRRFGTAYRQLILVGHGGKALWEAVRAAGMDGEHPIDDFSLAAVAAWLAEQAPGCRHAVLYPGGQSPDLLALGRLAGWHHPSPLGIGINEHWGTWFAYRVALLADSDLEPTPRLAGQAPCMACRGQPCITACPAGALAGGALELEKCAAWRLRPDSPCRDRCLARAACPVGAGHRYGDAQAAHTYLRSLEAIAAWYGSLKE